MKHEDPEVDDAEATLIAPHLGVLARHLRIGDFAGTGRDTGWHGLAVAITP